MTRLETDKAGEIDLDLPVSPAILAGILGISIPMVYQGRQDGKLPPESNATYRNCIQQYVQWHKKRSNVKASSMAERKMLQEIRNGIAKEEQTWLDIKAKRELLIDKQEVANIVEPIFYLVKSGLVNLARKRPEVQEEIDGILRSWATLGERMVSVADMDADKFVRAMLEADPEESIEKEAGFPSED